jgi:gas vesicle protein
MSKIAVEQPYLDIQQALRRKGYNADMIDQREKGAPYDVLVVRNLESYDEFRFKGSIIEVTGRTVNEVVDEVEERLMRAGKIQGQAKAEKTSSGGGFFTGFLSGAVIGSAAALLLAPKSGKEMQTSVKEKLASSDSGSSTVKSGKLAQVKEKAADLATQAKEKATVATNQVKEKVSSTKENQEKTPGQSPEVSQVDMIPKEPYVTPQTPNKPLN